MASPMTGGCLCGAVRYECTGEPVFALLCHCRDCQRQSGSAYAAAVRVPAASFRVTQGEPKLYVKTADSGNQVSRAFCPECGCMLFLRGFGATGFGRHQGRHARRPELVSAGCGHFRRQGPALGSHEPGSPEIRDLSARTGL